MNQWKYSAVLYVCACYLVGGINPSYLLARLRGFDIRSRGSRNAGASNAAMLLGKSAGLFCALFDLFKAYFAVRLSVRLFPLVKSVRFLAGTACILGHIFPLQLHFQGGKGLACLGGTLLAYDARLFALLLSLEFLLALLTDYICTVATTGSLLFGAIILFRDGLFYALLFAPVIAAIWFRHWINFRRIRYGVEARFCFLWNREREEARLKANWSRLSEDEKRLVRFPELG